MAAHTHRTRGGILRGLLLALLCFFAVVAVAWTLLLPAIVAWALKEQTGFGVRIEELTVNPFTARAEFRGLMLRNPASYPLEDFLEVRAFRADAELLSLLGDRLVANEVVVDVPKLTLVRNAHGHLNARAFRDSLRFGADNGAQTAARKFLIRHLVLKFDHLVYADYSGTTTSVKDYNLRLRRDLRDVTSLAQILNPLAGAFTGAGMTADNVGPIFRNSGNALKATGETLRDAGRKTGETLKSVVDSLEKKMPKK
jgi:uncharacterized protein involved in outer membrane biogenesis